MKGNFMTNNEDKMKEYLDLMITADKVANLITDKKARKAFKKYNKRLIKYIDALVWRFHYVHNEKTLQLQRDLLGIKLKNK